MRVAFGRRLRHNLYVHDGNAGDIAARSIETGDQSHLDWVAAGTENDRDRGRGGFRRKGWRSATIRNRDDGHSVLDQVGRQIWEPTEVVLRKAVFDREVAALDKAGLAQALTECPPG